MIIALLQKSSSNFELCKHIYVYINTQHDISSYHRISYNIIFKMTMLGISKTRNTYTSICGKPLLFRSVTMHVQHASWSIIEQKITSISVCLYIADDYYRRAFLFTFIIDQHQQIVWRISTLSHKTIWQCLHVTLVWVQWLVV